MKRYHCTWTNIIAQIWKLFHSSIQYFDGFSIKTDQSSRGETVERTTRSKVVIEQRSRQWDETIRNNKTNKTKLQEQDMAEWTGKTISINSIYRVIIRSQRVWITLKNVSGCVEQYSECWYNSFKKHL